MAGGETCPTTNKGENNDGAQEQPGGDTTNQGLHKNLLARVAARAVPNLTWGKAGTDLWMAKIKTYANMVKLQAAFPQRWEAYWE
jgi:hypothetical protein